MRRTIFSCSLLLLVGCEGVKKGSFVSGDAPLTPNITVTNNCSTDVWMAYTSNAGSPDLSDGIVNLSASGGSHGYLLPDSGWAGRLWPKTGCDSNGQSCATGQSVPPCPSTGCQPPADTKIEFFFGPRGGDKRPFYDVSLVDGFSLPMKIVPSGAASGTCVPTSCALDLSSCPKAEVEGIGDLRVQDGPDTVQCMSPCKKWTWPEPLGDGKNEGMQPGLDMCCPKPPVTPTACQVGKVEQTKYVALVRKECPTAYSYSFDDQAGSHDCDPGTSFSVTLCPEESE